MSCRCSFDGVRQVSEVSTVDPHCCCQRGVLFCSTFVLLCSAARSPPLVPVWRGHDGHLRQQRHTVQSGVSRLVNGGSEVIRSSCRGAICVVAYAFVGLSTLTSLDGVSCHSTLDTRQTNATAPRPPSTCCVPLSWSGVGLSLTGSRRVASGHLPCTFALSTSLPPTPLPPSTSLT